MRNFSVHVFEGEELVLMYLQYWREGIYQRMIQNVAEVERNRHLAFLRPLVANKKVQVNP